MTTLFTIGHSTHEAETLLGLLRGAGIERVIDVRIAPGSRRHPHVARAELERWLPAEGVAYAWRGEDLGGHRRARSDSPHTALRNDSFRGYADHMDTAPFRAALDRLVTAADEAVVAIMCAEALWWRCHRSMIADALVVRDVEVRHVMPDGSETPHELRPFARPLDGGVRYDVEAQPRLDEAGP